MTAKQRALLSNSGIAITRRGQLYRVTHYRFSGPTRCRTVVGSFYTRQDAEDAAKQAGLDYRSFDAQEWAGGER